MIHHDATITVRITQLKQSIIKGVGVAGQLIIHKAITHNQGIVLVGTHHLLATTFWVESKLTL